MKVGVIGVGRVGAACALSLVVRGSAREVILIDRTRARAKAVATDLRYGAPLCPEVALRDGDYADLAGADLVMLTAGVNEKSGGATDRNDREGRLKLLDTNVSVFKDMVPKIVEVFEEEACVSPKASMSAMKSEKLWQLRAGQKKRHAALE